MARALRIGLTFERRTCRAGRVLCVGATLAVLTSAFSPAAGSASAAGDPFVQQATLTSSGSGVALSKDGSTAAAGGGGQVRMYARSGPTWTQQGGPLSGEGGFGSSVSLSADGKTALMGAPADNGGAGSASVFTRSGETWTQQGGKLTGGGVSGEAEFGATVSLSADGNTALITAPHVSAGNPGVVWIFTRSGETWSKQRLRLTITDFEDPGFGAGAALSADGATAIVGAPGHIRHLHGPREPYVVGVVWLFSRTGESWKQQGDVEGIFASGELHRSGEFKSIDEFGRSVALSGDGSTALVGGPARAPSSGAVLGAAWTFVRHGEAWSQQGGRLSGSGELPREFGSEFGTSVSLAADGNTALIGGPEDNLQSGAAWIFTRSGETWTQQGHKLTSGEFGSGRFGQGVALSPDASSALIATPGDPSARVFVPGAAKEPPREPPEFGECLKTVGGGGEFSSSACTAKAEGKYEWEPGVLELFTQSKNFSTKITEGSATLESVGGIRVVCTGETGGGEYATNKAVAGVTLDLTGCQGLGQKCTSPGAAEAEVRTSPLEGMLGVQALGATAENNKVALEVSAGGGSPVSQFSCGATAVSVRGSLLLPLITNTPLASAKLKFVASKGKQKPESFEGGPRDVLEASFNGGAYQQVGLTLKLTQTNVGQPVEVNSVF